MPASDFLANMALAAGFSPPSHILSEERLNWARLNGHKHKAGSRGDGDEAQNGWRTHLWAKQMLKVWRGNHIFLPLAAAIKSKEREIFVFLTFSALLIKKCHLLRIGVQNNYFS